MAKSRIWPTMVEVDFDESSGYVTITPCRSNESSLIGVPSSAVESAARISKMLPTKGLSDVLDSITGCQSNVVTMRCGLWSSIEVTVSACAFGSSELELASPKLTWCRMSWR